MPRGLAVAAAAGAASALILGVYLGVYLDGRVAGPVDGPAISITFEADSYGRGEDVIFHISNTGSVPLVFDDVTLGWRVTDLPGVWIYEPERTGERETLEPGMGARMVWGQEDMSGAQVPPGIYRISVDSPRASATVTIR